MKFDLKTILLVGIAVLATVLLTILFKKHPPNEKAIRNEEKVRSLERELIYKDSIYKETIAVLDSQINILSDRIAINKTSITQSNERIKTLPARINSMSIDDVLRTIDE